MILDSSALAARINAAESVAVNAVSLVEAGIVLSSRIGEDATEVLAICSRRRTLS